jgi:hypothetical protein
MTRDHVPFVIDQAGTVKPKVSIERLIWRICFLL